MAEVEYGQIFNPSSTHNWWWSDCLLKRIRWLAAKRFLCRELEVEPPMEHRHPPLGRAATVGHQGHIFDMSATANLPMIHQR